MPREKESSRTLFDLTGFEDNLYAQGYEAICGVDEVGRGPWLGRWSLPPWFCLVGSLFRYR